METKIARQTVTQNEAAKILGVHWATVHRMCRDGRLSSFKLGRTKRIPLAALEQIIGYPVRLEPETRE